MARRLTTHRGARRWLVIRRLRGVFSASPIRSRKIFPHLVRFATLKGRKKGAFKISKKPISSVVVIEWGAQEDRRHHRQGISLFVPLRGPNSLQGILNSENGNFETRFWPVLFTTLHLANRHLTYQWWCVPFFFWDSDTEVFSWCNSHFVVILSQSLMRFSRSTIFRLVNMFSNYLSHPGDFQGSVWPSLIWQVSDFLIFTVCRVWVIAACPVSIFILLFFVSFQFYFFF